MEVLLFTCKWLFAIVYANYIVVFTVMSKEIITHILQMFSFISAQVLLRSRKYIRD